MQNTPTVDTSVHWRLTILNTKPIIFNTKSVIFIQSPSFLNSKSHLMLNLLVPLATKKDSMRPVRNLTNSSF